MKTKIIPFDLETAKKIQAGEIKGKIKTRGGRDVRVVCWDRKNENNRPIVALIDYGATEVKYAFPEKGTWNFFSSTQFDLILEVPDNDPQFKVGDKVRVRPNNTHSFFVKQYDNWVGKIVGTCYEYFIVIVTGAFQDQFLAEELELVDETQKHEFKPFDRVLVRDEDKQKWACSMFSHLDKDQDGIVLYNDGSFEWRQCIPYEGNEDLVGTTNMPKED